MSRDCAGFEWEYCGIYIVSNTSNLSMNYHVKDDCLDLSNDLKDVEKLHGGREKFQNRTEALCVAS
jgi:hypothetical protein